MVLGIRLLALGAAAFFAFVLAGRWADQGFLPLMSHYEACLQGLVGLSLGAAILSRGGPVGIRSSAGACLIGIGLGLLALADDREPLFAPPSVQAFPAFVHYTLKWISYGFMLAAVGGAGARLLDRRTGDGIPEAWDGALHRVVRVGLPGLLVAVAVGACWHQSIGWSAWDVGETWDIAVLLSFLGWLHLRQVVPPISRTPSFVLLAGGVLMAGRWTFLHLVPGAVNSLEIYN